MLLRPSCSECFTCVASDDLCCLLSLKESFLLIWSTPKSLSISSLSTPLWPPEDWLCFLPSLVFSGNAVFGSLLFSASDAACSHWFASLLASPSSSSSSLTLSSESWSGNLATILSLQFFSKLPSECKLLRPFAVKLSLSLLMSFLFLFDPQCLPSDSLTRW